MALRHRLAGVALLLLIAASAYGVVHEHLFAEHMLSAGGQHRLFRYTLMFWAVSGAFLWLAPRWLGAGVASAVILYTLWWSGLAAPLAVLYLFGACFLTGRILTPRADGVTATVLGLAVWLSAVWVALHFPVNTRPIYAAAFAIPYLWEARRLRTHARGFRWLCASRFEAAGLAVLLFVLLAHWLVALKPEVSADGMSMHLVLPMKVAQLGRWPFDFKHETWSLMPAGGDSIFTAAYVLAGEPGGEAAAKLANFALLVLIAAMVAQVSRRWLPPGQALLVAALFASTPLVQLVTGSLFVENAWAVLILGGVLALVRFEEAGAAEDLQIAGALFGAALAVKLMAAVFLVPAAMLAVWIALRRKQFHALFSAAWWMLVLAAPPYLYALVQSGNPVFPFENNIFRSPYFDATQPFTDSRFTDVLSWHMPYDLTFRSGRFFEGQAGAAGFQYFLLLALVVLLFRKRAQWLILAIGAGGAAILLVVLPNLRYLYPALPLLSVAIGVMLTQWPRTSAAIIALVALNIWFLPTSGWYQSDFALFRKRQAADYLRDGVPAAALIERLNREAPGQAAAFFSTDAVAGLRGPAYADSWHNYPYSTRLSDARSAGEIAGILQEYNIRHIIAPASLKADFPVVETFLRQWAEPDGPANGRLALFRLRENRNTALRPIPPFPAGSWDDLDERIEYNGAWMHDRQFPQTLNQSVSYSDVAGDWVRFAFTGSGVTYVFTEAINRGTALVLIDGTERARIDMFSPQTMWQVSRGFEGLGAGTHTFELRVLEEKNPRSTGTFVDLDGIVVRP